MDEFPKLKAVGIPKKVVAPVDVSLLSNSDRTALRAGSYINTKTIEYIPILKNKQPISIIITAYQTQDYIEECLDSIEAQTYFINNDDYEVLVGVDACQDTLNKLLEIRNKYRNLRIFMMCSNLGTYITSNTLLNIIKNENIIRFDSDDIMMSEMINEIMYFSDEYDMIKFSFLNFIEGVGKSINKDFRIADGAIFYKKWVLDMAGGYRDWICGADSEFCFRVMSHIKIKKISKHLFYRRQHQNSLTKKPKTVVGGELRNKYVKEIRKYDMNEEINIIKKINEYYEV